MKWRNEAGTGGVTSTVAGKGSRAHDVDHDCGWLPGWPSRWPSDYRHAKGRPLAVMSRCVRLR